MSTDNALKRNKKIIIPAAIALAVLLCIGGYFVFVNVHASAPQNGVPADTDNQSITLDMEWDDMVKKSSVPLSEEEENARLIERAQTMLETLDGVTVAKITLSGSGQSTSAFAELTLAQGKTLSEEQQTGVKKMIAGSFQNLTQEQVELKISFE